MKASPLEKKNHHNPGQSLQRMILKTVLRWLIVLSVVFVVNAFLLGCIFGAYDFIAQTARIVFIPFVVFALVFMFVVDKRVNKSLDNMILGLEGERGVGLYLNRLWSETSFVFHDLQGTWKNGNKFNIDHLVVSTKGVFVFETKTLSKDDRKPNIVTFEDNTIKIN